jgi:hypothetical protein
MRQLLCFAACPATQPPKGRLFLHVTLCKHSRATEGHSRGRTSLSKGRSDIPFFAVFFPVLTTLNISSSAIPLTFGNGTENLAAFSFRLFLTNRGQLPNRKLQPVFERTRATQSFRICWIWSIEKILWERSSRRFVWCRRPREEQGVSAFLPSRPFEEYTKMNQNQETILQKTPSWPEIPETNLDINKAPRPSYLRLRSSRALICFFICIFSWCRFLWYSFARRPTRLWAFSDSLWPSLASLLRVLSSWSSLRARQFDVFVCGDQRKIILFSRGASSTVPCYFEIRLTHLIDTIS